MEVPIYRNKQITELKTVYINKELTLEKSKNNVSSNLVFGSLMPGRSFNANSYRFGFNGKLKDDEWYNVTGSMYDYGARMYDSRLGRFPSPDPLIVKDQKYPELSPYQYASNTPIWGVDWDGLEVRIYTETNKLGHTFITVQNEDDIIVYTYGRYLGGGKNKSSAGGYDPSGKGVLIRMTGNEAKRYIKHELNDKNAKAFELTKIDQKKVKNYYDKIYNSGNKLNEKETNEFERKNQYGTAKQARVIDEYNIIDNNCTTKSIEATKQTSKGSEIFMPEMLQEILEVISSSKNSDVKEVTGKMKKQVKKTNSGASGSW